MRDRSRTILSIVLLVALRGIVASLQHSRYKRSGLALHPQDAARLELVNEFSARSGSVERGPNSNRPHRESKLDKPSKRMTRKRVINMLNIGCHLSTRKGLLNMAQAAASIGANAIQFFTRNPRGGHAREVNEKDLSAFKGFAKEHGIDHLLAYAPYTLEPASTNMTQRDFARMVIAEDLARMESLPGHGYLVRPGSAKEQTREAAITHLVDTLNQTLAPAQHTTLLLATMPGSGTQICSTFEEMASVLEGVNLGDHVGICFDASAVWAAGYNIVEDLPGVLEQLDSTVGLSRVKAVHLNDCKEACGARADRHARIGEGAIGFDALSALVNDPAFAGVPFYLEEPSADLSIYHEDIERFTDAYHE